VLDLNLVDMTNLYRVRSAIESEAAAYLTEEAFDDIFDESDEETEEMPDDL